MDNSSTSAQQSANELLRFNFTLERWVRTFRFKPNVQGFRFSKEIPVDLSIYATDRIRKWSEWQRRFSGWNHWNSEKDISCVKSVT